MGEETSTKPKRTFFGHPMGLLNLFSTELCERFSYYGMRAILIYYIYDSVTSGGLGIDHTTALVIMSLFGSLVYLSSIVGGWMADRVFGPYKGVLYGGLIITAGHVVLGLPLGALGLFAALLLIILGTGLLKPNVSVMVGELYSTDDPRRQSGFSLLVMAINIGSFLSPLIVGTTSAAAGYHIAFLIPAAMMIVAIAVYVLMGRSTLRGIGREAVAPLTAHEKKKWAGIVSAVVVVLVVVGSLLAMNNLLDISLIGDFLPVVCTVVAAVIFVFIIRDKKISATERSRVYAFIPIFLAAAMFWALSEQQSSTIALVADTRVDNDVLGLHIPPSWYASINPLVIIILSPLFAVLWTKLGKKQPSMFVKMAGGLVMACGGFAILGIAFFASGSGQISPLWVLAGMTVMTVGELLLSPIGLSATTLLAPERHKSKMMSLWFISNALGQGVIAIAVNFFDEANPEDYYLAFACAALVVGLILFLLRNKLLALAKGVR